MNRVVDQYWANYDKDGNGFLDMNEVRPFAEHIMASVGVKAQDVTEENCKNFFTSLDLNQDGKVERSELMQFLKSLMDQ